MGKPLEATEVAKIFLALPRQSSIKKVMPFLESQYHNTSADMVVKWCLIRQQIELERAEAEKENTPLLPVTSDDVSPQLPASSSRYSSSSRPAVPLAAIVSVSVSPLTSPNHPTLNAPPQTIHTMLPSSSEAPAVPESTLAFPRLASGAPDLPTPLLDTTLANPDTIHDAIRPSHSEVTQTQDGEEH